MADNEDVTDTTLHISLRQDLGHVDHDGSMETLAVVQTVVIAIEESFNGLTEIGLQVTEENLGADTNIQCMSC